jgi:hypothetical protein
MSNDLERDIASTIARKYDDHVNKEDEGSDHEVVARITRKLKPHAAEPTMMRADFVVGTVVALFLAAIIIASIGDHAPADWQHANEFKKYLCRMPEICTKYRAMRLECAVAGNFKNCITIKMGRDASLLDLCTEEGEPGYRDPATPNILECFLRKSDFLAKLIEGSR